MKGERYKIFFLIVPVLILSWLMFLFLPGSRFETADPGKDQSSAGPEISNPSVSGQSGGNTDSDIEFQKPLADPPEEVKAIYVTSDSAANAKKMDSLIGLVKKSGLNAMVIDIKDYSGYLSYGIASEGGAEYKTKKEKISKINSLIKKLHDENIYAIARIAVFQDPVLAAARPDLAVKNRSTGNVWKDNLNLAWIDPASRESWDYNVRIAQDASKRGFDEINFDYIRFPSDGRLSEMVFPFYGPENISKSESIREFFAYLRTNLAGVKISADIFGLTTVALDDLGIGQVIENAYQNFDYVSPMVYPSHYAPGFLGYQNPAEYPYEVVRHSIEGAMMKLEKYNKAEEDAGRTKSAAEIRPWIQAFNMGAVYDIAKIKAQIKASDQSGGTGWMLWNPANNYSFLNGF